MNADRNKNMTEENKVQFRHEGQPAFEADKENDNSSSSPEVDKKENEADTTHSPDGGGNSQDDPNKDTPFHEHPRWKEREADWNKKFNDQEARHQQDLADIRKEFGQARKDNANATEIPDWFGGTQEQWDAYRRDRDAELKSAEERAYERVKNEKSSEEKAVKEATDYMNSEIANLESDKAINPDGLKIDPNKLLKIVLDNDLIDSQGRWNYKAGFQILKNSVAKPKAPDTKERKEVAGALNSDSKPEKKPAPYKTSNDFKTNRPW